MSSFTILRIMPSTEYIPGLIINCLTKPNIKTLPNYCG